jgi:hypothetical protein
LEVGFGFGHYYHTYVLFLDAPWVSFEIPHFVGNTAKMRAVPWAPSTKFTGAAMSNAQPPAAYLHLQDIQ